MTVISSFPLCWGALSIYRVHSLSHWYIERRRHSTANVCLSIWHYSEKDNEHCVHKKKVWLKQAKSRHFWSIWMLEGIRRKRSTDCPKPIKKVSYIKQYSQDMSWINSGSTCLFIPSSHSQKFLSVVLSRILKRTVMSWIETNFFQVILKHISFIPSHWQGDVKLLTHNCRHITIMSFPKLLFVKGNNLHNDCTHQSQ